MVFKTVFTMETFWDEPTACDGLASLGAAIGVVAVLVLSVCAIRPLVLLAWRWVLLGAGVHTLAEALLIPLGLAVMPQRSVTATPGAGRVWATLTRLCWLPAASAAGADSFARKLDLGFDVGFNFGELSSQPSTTK